MAYSSWLTPSPTSGSGNGTIANTATSHTGRSQRSTTVTVNPSTGTAKTYSVTQQALPEFLTVSSLETVDANDTSFTLPGQSNSAKLTWSVNSAGTLGVSVPGTYTANGVATTNGANITDDPGASSQYNFSGIVSFSKNTTISTRTGSITITAGAGGAGLVKTISFSQSPASSAISISPTSATFIAAGYTNSVTVSTNSTFEAFIQNADWLSVTPSTGSNTVTSVTAAPYFGRLSRTGTIDYRTQPGGTAEETFTATQTGHAEYVSFNPAIYEATKAGGNITLNGVTNSSKLTFSINSGGTASATLPSTYTIESVSTANGASINGDPGAEKECEFTIVIQLSANLTVNSKFVDITVTPNGGSTLASSARINQSAGDATLSVSPTTITLPASGTATGSAGTVNVVSNVSWTVS